MTDTTQSALFDELPLSRGGPIEPATPLLTWPGRRPMPDGLYLGTSSWYFPGWHRLVWERPAPADVVAREGLSAYARHPLLRAVGIDRTFHAAIEQAVFERYAWQAGPDFRCLIKAPSSIADASVRSDDGRATRENPHFLDASLATSCFIEPCLRGLKEAAGVLLFQCSPLPPSMLERVQQEPADFARRIGDFFAALPLPRDLGAPHAIYALELRDAALLTPRLIAALRETSTRYCIGLHPRMPSFERQAAALAALDKDRARGPLIVRWNLLPGLRYEDARKRFAPFDQLLAPDVDTRGRIAELAVRTLRDKQPVYVIVNNKAEGSAPRSVIALAEAIAARIDAE